MNAVALKFADGKPTGIWYCGKCREIFDNVSCGGKPDSEHHREKAEECCTGATTWVPARWKIGGQCTGCNRGFADCICGRAKKNRCVSCEAKLFQREGRKVRWGTDVREVCHACAIGPAKKLVDAAQ